jgi:tRNA(fMet)-specific endonuclease VapC
LSWTLRKRSAPKFQQGLTALLSDVSVLDLTIEVAQKFGELRAELFDRGQPVASVDVMIAATAIVHELTVVTHNTQHFSRIPGLTVDDWVGA